MSTKDQSGEVAANTARINQLKEVVDNLEQRVKALEEDAESNQNKIG